MTEKVEKTLVEVNKLLEKVADLFGQGALRHRVKLIGDVKLPDIGLSLGINADCNGTCSGCQACEGCTGCQGTAAPTSNSLIEQLSDPMVREALSKY